MDELHRLLLVERACTRLNLDYCHAIDSGHASQIADLFTRDGVWDRGDVVLEGRNAIRAFFLARERVIGRVSRHLITNLDIRDVSDTQATGSCYFANFAYDREGDDLSLPVPSGEPKYVGEYCDRFELTRDGWRFAQRLVNVAFLRAEEPDRRSRHPPDQLQTRRHSK